MEQPTPPRQEKRLHRSARHRLLFGVCGGLAEYFDIDPTIVRIGFIALTLVSFGAGVILYLALALIMPPPGAAETEPREMLKENVREMRAEAEHAIDRLTGIFRR